MEKRIEKVRARLSRLAGDYMQETVTDAYNELGRMAAEIERLRKGLKLITCEPINAEYMAQNILDGLPPYHNTMLDTETHNADVTGLAPKKD